MQNSKTYKNEQVNAFFNNLARMRKSSSLKMKQNPIAKKGFQILST